jgi:hypothetical protein
MAGLAALVSVACAVRAVSAFQATEPDTGLVYVGGALITAAAAAVAAIVAFKRHPH